MSFIKRIIDFFKGLFGGGNLAEALPDAETVGMEEQDFAPEPQATNAEKPAKAKSVSDVQEQVEQE